MLREVAVRAWIDGGLGIGLQIVRGLLTSERSDLLAVSLTTNDSLEDEGASSRLLGSDLFANPCYDVDGPWKLDRVIL